MALFKTTEELAVFFPARLTLDFADIAPTMDRVENDYLVAQVLGEQQYNELHTAYQTDAMTSRLDDLLLACRRPIAELAIYHWASTGSLQVTSGGLVAAGTANSGGNNIANLSRIEAFRLERMNAGFSGLDRLLGFLQARIADFPLWAASVFASYGTGLMRTTAQFHAAVDIANSHWLFWRMRNILPRHQDAESLIANTLCSTDLYDQLVSESNAGDAWTGTNKQIIDLIRPAIAHLAMAEAVTELSLAKDQRGVWTFTVGSSEASGPKPAEESRLGTWQQYHRDRGNEFVGALDRKLKKLAAAGQCALYAASTCYTTYAAGTDVVPRDTTRRAGGFM